MGGCIRDASRHTPDRLLHQHGSNTLCLHTNLVLLGPDLQLLLHLKHQPGRVLGGVPSAVHKQLLRDHEAGGP